MCPNSGYFDVPFGVDGTLVTVPDAIQSDGSVSYTQGWGVDYTLPNTNPSYKYMPQGQFNQLFYDITSAIQNWQQKALPPFITSSMNGGSPFSYSQYNMVLYGGVGYISLVNSNTDTPPSAKWAVINLNGAAFYSGGVTTGTASNQVLSTVVPTGYALVEGVTVACTAGFTCPGACNAAIAGSANTAIKIWNGTSYADPAANQFLLDETIFLSYNATHAVYVLTDAPTLGTAAAKAASNNADATVASVTGSVTAGHIATFADSSGSVQDGGAPVLSGKYTSPQQTITTGGALTLAHGLGAAPFMLMTSIVCQTAEFGYSAGDELLISTSAPFGATSNGAEGAAVTFDATNIYVRFSNDTVLDSLLNKSTGATVILTLANWKLVIRALA